MINMKFPDPLLDTLTLLFGQNNADGREPVNIPGEQLQTVNRFKHLGSSVDKGGVAKITQRVWAA